MDTSGQLETAADYILQTKCYFCFVYPSNKWIIPITTMKVALRHFGVRVCERVCVYVNITCKTNVKHKGPRQKRFRRIIWGRKEFFSRLGYAKAGAREIGKRFLWGKKYRNKKWVNMVTVYPWQLYKDFLRTRKHIPAGILGLCEDCCCSVLKAFLRVLGLVIISSGRRIF